MPATSVPATAPGPGVERARAELRRMRVLVGDGPDARLELRTSGTSAAARTVVRSLASWERSFAHVTALTGIRPTDRVLVPAPPTGSMFAFARAHAAHVGAEVVALPRWSVREAVSALASCTVAHFTPSMLAALVERDPGRLRTVVCAGAVLPDAVRRAAHEAGVEVVDYYGAAELSFVAMRSGSCLTAFPEVEVETRDGVIWARSPWVCEGYAAGQSGPLRRDGDGWATVGDRGHVDDDGGLVVLGRGDDVVTTGGATVLCADVELVLGTSPGVSAALVVGTPHPGLGECLEAVLVGPDDLDLDVVRSRSAGLLAASHTPRRWHRWEDLPLTEAGKVDRAAVRRRLVSGRDPEPAS